MFVARVAAGRTLTRAVTGAQFVRPFHTTLYSSHAGCGSKDPCNHEDTVVARCTHKITELLKPQKIKVTSSNDDPNGSHIQVEVISEEFTGKNVVQRQRLVYKAIWEELQGPVHAVDSIIAKTPKEAGL